jgi:hypothetical protein
MDDLVASISLLNQLILCSPFVVGSLFRRSHENHLYYSVSGCLRVVLRITQYLYLLPYLLAFPFGIERFHRFLRLSMRCRIKLVFPIREPLEI